MRRPWLLLALVGCAGRAEDSDTLFLPTGYRVVASTEPSPPQAGETVEITLRVFANDEPAENLQRTHERMIHTFLIPRDLEDFAHVHHEDFAEVTAGDLKQATYHFPFAFPTSGEHMLFFEFAAENQYRTDGVWAMVEGEPAQLEDPVLDLATTTQDGDLHAELRWDVAPVAGEEAQFTLILTDDTAQPVTDVVQWLGADAHVALVHSDLSWVGHSHAWISGMENAPPDHVMPHTYDGPEIPFRTTFPTAGTHRMWAQVARAGAPSAPALLRLDFEVAP